MNVYHSIAELGLIPGPLFLAIGVFDGVHLGHQAVIQRACDDARSAGGTPVVVTFDPHPVRVLRPDQAPRLLTSTQHKVQLIREFGVQHLLLVRFDRDFAATEPAHFIREPGSGWPALARDLCRNTLGPLARTARAIWSSWPAWEKSWVFLRSEWRW